MDPVTITPITPPARVRFRAYGPDHLDEIATRFGLSARMTADMKRVALVLPFRVNEYVLTELIDWSNVPADPIFQLLFPQRGMLRDDEEPRLEFTAAAGSASVESAIRDIRRHMNPHPSGQVELNVPSMDGEPLAGIQHKYLETVLYFPSQGQTCHAYCTYCFRWAQFVGDRELRIAATGPAALVDHLRRHPAATDVLVTGGDPMVMSTTVLRRHIEPVLRVESVRTIRIGTKALAYWPHRFVTDPDADDVLRLFESVVRSGRTLAVMAHFTHPRELTTDVTRAALERVRATGALVYCQGPLVAHVNDDVTCLAELWRRESAAGLIPYYLFVERDTGPHHYFAVPLARAVDLFSAAYRSSSGLARTIRGPVMSATLGKVTVDGVESTPSGRYFQLRLLQARNPQLVGRPFRARFSETATWLGDLEIDEAAPTDIRRALEGVPASEEQ